MKKISIIASILIMVCFSCDRPLDEAPCITYDGEANMTIAELLDLHSVGSVDSYSEIPDGTVICGTITSSDETGNCYKYITIQDETGAIMIKIDDSALFPKYQPGQKVYVKCGEMQIGDYRKNKQLGFWVDGSMTGISSSQEDLYIFRDGMIGAEPEAEVINSKYDITEATYNKLVKLQNCHFAEGGSANFCDPGANTSRDIVMADGSIIVLRTSSYAKFANDLLPSGDGDIYGIMTIYNTTPQFVIRSLDDIHFITQPQTTTVNVVDFSNDPIANQGWSVQGDDGWFYYAAGPAFAIQNQTSEMIDSWLVSPTINISNISNVKLILEQQANATAGELELYYTTTGFNGTNFDENSWTRFNYGEEFPQSATSNSHFRIAFRFHDANGANWRISKVQFQGIER